MAHVRPDTRRRPARPCPSINVLGGALQPCSAEPLTGFYRDGCCNTGREDVGLHTVCVVMTAGVPGLLQGARQRSLHADAAIRLPRPEARRPLVPVRRALEGSARRRRCPAGRARGHPCGDPAGRPARRTEEVRFQASMNWVRTRSRCAHRRPAPGNRGPIDHLAAGLVPVFGQGDISQRSLMVS